MEHLPIYIYLIFGLTVLLAFTIFYKASHNSKSFLFIALIWMFILSFLSLSNRYTLTKSMLPLFPLLTIPPTIFVIGIFFTRRGKEFIQHLNLKTLMILHFLRIPVEIVLFSLAAYSVIPKSLTFEGRNFDILVGLTAPVIYYFGFVKIKLNKAVIIVWNIVGLALLLNVVFNAVYTVLVLKQPNFALGYFPFFLLPSLLVPLVMFSHLASIKLEFQKNNIK